MLHKSQQYSISTMNSTPIDEFKIDQRRFLEEKLSILNPISKLVVNFNRQYGILSIYKSPFSENIIAKIYLPKTLRTIVMLIHPQEFLNNEKSTQNILAKRKFSIYQESTKQPSSSNFIDYDAFSNKKMKFGDYVVEETGKLKNKKSVFNPNRNESSSPIYRLNSDSINPNVPISMFSKKNNQRHDSHKSIYTFALEKQNKSKTLKLQEVVKDIEAIAMEYRDDQEEDDEEIEDIINFSNALNMSSVSIVSKTKLSLTPSWGRRKKTTIKKNLLS